jgi:isopentenyl-diphosphate delta-isomerase
VCSLKNQHFQLKVIASGGIQNGLDIAKAVAFGADMTGMARPMLQALEAGGPRHLEYLLEKIGMELRGAMFLTGSRSIGDLQRQQLILKRND